MTGIYVGIGGNLAWAPFATPLATLTAAVEALPAAGFDVRRRSQWYRSAPWPPSDQPECLNAVLDVATGLSPADALSRLHGVEKAFGRVRGGGRDAARTVDLDVLAWGDRVLDAPGGPLLPHPRMHERAFVLLPLGDLAPMWRHPISGLDIAELLARVPAGQWATPLVAPREATR